MTSGPTIQSALREVLERAPDRRAVGFASLDRGIEWLTAAELHREAAALAARLGGLGLGTGDIAVLVTADIRFGAIAIAAVLRQGAVPLLVAPPAIQGVGSNLGLVIRHVVGLTGARLVLLPEGMQASADELAAACPATTPVVGPPGADTEPLAADDIAVPDADEIAALQLTSGTTGFPRVCVWRHEQVLAAVEGMSRAMGLGADEVYANWTPLYHDMGLVNNYLLCLLRGIPLALIDPLDFIRRPDLWLRTMHEARATQTWAPNFGFAVAAERVRDEEIEGLRLDCVRGFWNAGEKVHIKTFEEFHARFRDRGVRWSALKANFGCAENVGGATFTDPRGELVVERVRADALREERRAVVADDAFTGATERVVSTGRGHPLLEVYVLDDEDRPVADGVVGQVALVTPSRLVGFLGQPEESAKVIRGRYLLTGDLGYLRDGELFWVGRKRERINLAGVKHDPSDFEAVVGEVEGLRKGCFAAFGVEDERIGTQRLVLLCEVAADAARELRDIAAELRRLVATRLGVTPGEVALVQRGALTKTSSGKRRHLHFRDVYLGGGLKVLYREGVVRPHNHIAHPSG